VQPTAADDVVIPSGATVTIPVSTTVSCRSLTVQSGGALTFTGAPSSSVLNIGDGTAGAGNVAINISSGATITLTAGDAQINLISTSATQQTITSGGKTIPSMTINGAGSSYVLADNYTGASTSTSLFNLQAGTFDTGNFNFSPNIFNSNGTGVRTLTMGSSAITLVRNGGALGFSGTNLTITANTAVITCTASATVQSGGFNMNGASLVFSGAGAIVTLQNGGTWKDITYNGSASKGSQFLISTSGFTCTGTFTITGNSKVNRILVASTVRGTSMTITAATVAINAADFMDIVGAGAASWDLSAVSDYSGDAGGNSGITFTSAINQTYSGGTGTWSTLSWTTRAPLPQDNTTITGTGTITNDMPRLGKDLNFTGFSGTFSSGGNWENYGSLTFSNGMTLSTASFAMSGRGIHTITWNGKTIGGSTFTINGFGGTFTLQDTFSSTGTFALTSGTLDSNNQAITSGQFTNSSTNTRALTLGTTTWTILSTSGTFWNTTASAFTGSMEFSTIVLSQASSTTRQFTGGGQAYGTLTYTVASSTGQLTLTGGNSFVNLNVSGGTRTLAIPTGSTTTVANFNVFGTAGNVVGVVSANAGTRAVLNRLRGVPVSTDYVAFQDIAYAIPYGFYAGVNSTDNGNNLNVIFTTPATVPYIYEIGAPGQQLTATNNTVTFTAPQVGSLLIYSVMIQNAFGTMTDPVGWSLAVQRSQATSSHIWVWYKISDGTETSVGCSWTTSRIATGTFYQARGFLGVPTLDGTDSNGSTSATTVSTGAGVSNTVTQGIAFAFMGGNGGLGAVASPVTNSFQEDFTLGLGSANVSTKSAAKPLTSVGLQSTTFSWSTGRVPVSALVIFKSVSVSKNGNFLMFFNGF